ncbi:hypothetical protein ACRYCC_19520 [Actinomadura scrupuli]|uniref:hypothetical protein n=1 Tax=Actinomadura scrupuli TaxID=559629 RepID=UPI003D988A38
MICTACRNRDHGQCRGGSWCDCQHQPASAPAGETVPAGETGGRAAGARPGSSSGSAAQEARTEPPVNWIRQG